MKDKKITIKEIAKEAGVSISTVSRVINSTTPVSEPLKTRVIEASQRFEERTNRCRGICVARYFQSFLCYGGSGS